jgi:hypothetical protein
MSPEARTRMVIDWPPVAAGWHVCGYKASNIHMTKGVAAMREFQLGRHEYAAHLVYIDGSPAGIIEGKKRGATLP